ncbi:hypothetical protein LZ31DRAFT_157103 [Colletotrichum somersetense]|nr:hypothetical protein LZ31DRAFT_157103 [Colletotrichum somersetense]
MIQKHTTPGIRWSSPTQLLIRPSLAYLWESGRDPEFSSGYGRMWRLHSCKLTIMVWWVHEVTHNLTSFSCLLGEMTDPGPGDWETTLKDVRAKDSKEEVLTFDAVICGSGFSSNPRIRDFKEGHIQGRCC